MENKYDYYSNFNFYDKKGRRLSVFAEHFEENPNTLAITIIPCSKLDQFSKKIGRRMFEEEKAPVGDTIPIVDNKPKKSFMDYCYKNLYKMRPVTTYKLVNAGSMTEKTDPNNYLGEKH